MALTRVYEVLKRRFGNDDVVSPLEFEYINLLRVFMTTIGAWPYKQFGRKRLDVVLSLYNLLLTIVGVVMLFSASAYAWFYREKISLFDLGHTVLCMCIGILFLQRVMLTRFDKYREAVKVYLLKFHLFYFKNQSEYAAKIHYQIHIISGVFTVYVICQLACGTCLFSLMPWYNNYSRGLFGDHPPANTTFEHAVYYYCFTEDVYTTVQGYWWLFAFNLLTSYTNCVGLCFYDLLICLIVLQIWGHLRILKHKLLSMPLPVKSFDGMYSAEENIQIRQLLRESIEHHNIIISFVDKCSDTFSEYLFVFYLLMQFITCILLLEVSSLTADALAKYGPLTQGLHQQLIQVSILFEMLNTKSEQLIEAVYLTPWEYMDSSNRRTVAFLLQRVQSPVALKAAKLVPVGVTTMSTVLKTTFSYYMMLKAVAEEP